MDVTSVIILHAALEKDDKRKIRMAEFNHFDNNGNAVMVDVSDKEVTTREASASGIIHVSSEIMEAVLNRSVKKGDVLGVARVAGITAAKHTWEMIPMCHLITLRKCSVDFEISEKENTIKAVSYVKAEEKTGVEMEALTAVSAALLTIYDMCKALDKRMVIDEIKLLHKSGGKSGDFYA